MVADERGAPRISVNKVGEYMSAGPARRRAIIKAQKRPRTFIAARYTQAEDAIKNFFSNALDESILFQAIIDLDNSKPDTEWKETNKELCIDAIEGFIELLDELDVNFENMKLIPGDPYPPKLIVSDVEISVRPDIRIIETRKDGSISHGAIKLYFPKTFPLNKDSGQFVATIVRCYLEEVYADSDPVNNKLCMVFDVNSQQIFHAPRSYKRRMNDVEAACEEISRGWSFI